MVAVMGPVERELWARSAGHTLAMSADGAWELLAGAAKSLGIGAAPGEHCLHNCFACWSDQGLVPDVASEAIEAAEALGL